MPGEATGAINRDRQTCCSTLIIGKAVWSDNVSGKTLEKAVFGAGFRGLFVFAYQIVGDRAPLPPEQLLEHRGSLYGFVAVGLSDFAAGCHPISPSWDTVAMPAAEFRRLARPVDELFGTSCRSGSGAIV